MLRRGVVVSGIVLLLIGSVASAQQRKGPGPGGFGGFGFGGPGSMPSWSLMLLGIPEVQKELQLSDDQRAQIKQVTAESQKQRGQPFGGLSFEEIQELSQEERDKRLAEFRKRSEAANKQAEEKIEKILDADQLERLEQLRLQREGWMAFNRPEVAKRLGLTDEQQAKMKKIQEEARSGFGGFPGPDATENERREFFTRMRQRGEKMQADILAVLTEEQKEKWSAMKGKEFKFPQPKFPGGFGPGAKGGKAPARRPAPASTSEQ